MVTNAPGDLRGFNCPSCGAAVELRALFHAVSVACTSCGAILDPKNPTVVILQQAQQRQRVEPQIPLGTRGTWRGHPFEVIGFQRRSITVDGDAYAWDEYLLFNPYQGFRYLTEYDGHWNDVETMRGLPRVHRRGRRSLVIDGQRPYRHFQHAVAATTFVLGEFPWRVRVGDEVAVDDFVSPPRLLSREGTGEEETWSRGEYVSGDDVWRSFALPGTPPVAVGVFANQPSPYLGSPGRYWRAFALLALVLVGVFLVREATASREDLFASRYRFSPSAGDEAAFVSDVFTVPSAGTLDVLLDAGLNNGWLSLDLALISLETGQALNVARELSDYSGSDSDGPWREDAHAARVRLPSVPGGKYYLRIEPDGPDAGPQIEYSVSVRRDVPTEWPYGVALLLCAIPPVLVTMRASSFEARRWQESSGEGE